MSGFDDDQDMWSLPADELLSGEVVRGEPELTAFVAALEATATIEAPAPNAALRAVLGGEVDELPGATRRVRVGRGARLGLKLALGLGVAVASVSGAAALDAVPDGVRGPSRAAVTAVVDAWTHTIGWLTGSEPTGTTAPASPASDAAWTTGRAEEPPPSRYERGSSPLSTAPRPEPATPGAGPAPLHSPGAGPARTDEVRRSGGVPPNGSSAADEQVGRGAGRPSAGADETTSPGSPAGRGDASPQPAEPGAGPSPAPGAPRARR